MRSLAELRSGKAIFMYKHRYLNGSVSVIPITFCFHSELFLYLRTDLAISSTVSFCKLYLSVCALRVELSLTPLQQTDGGVKQNWTTVQACAPFGESLTSLQLNSFLYKNSSKET